MKKQLNIIVAMTDKYLIGTISNSIPWALTDDFIKNFVPKTTEVVGIPLIMGRKTEQTLKGPLVGRTNIVISRNTTLKREGFIFVKDEIEAMKVANESPGETIWCIGGAEIYKLFQNTFAIDEYHITIIKDFDKKFSKEEMILFAPNLSGHRLIETVEFEKRDPDPNKKRDRGNEYSFKICVFKKDTFKASLF
ncbi:MAG: dihydrofolate reductase [Patescibacteria group bacterium]|nr:dihydrofolate reductase [Patescibacteria group bacterium]